MCFSATASFGSGLLLTAVGVATLKKAQTPAQIPFASIPIIFGVQQFAEGFVWLSLTNPDFAPFRQPATYVFLLIAQAIWPILIPLAFLKLEFHPTRRRILTWLVGVGCLVVGFVLFTLFSQSVYAEVAAHHVKYHVSYPPFFTYFGGIPYFLAIVISPFISSFPKVKWLAWSTLGAFFLAKIFFANYLISVWCFFAAIVSIGVYLILLANQRVVPKRTVFAQNAG